MVDVNLEHMARELLRRVLCRENSMPASTSAGSCRAIGMVSLALMLGACSATMPTGSDAGRGPAAPVAEQQLSETDPSRAMSDSPVSEALAPEDGGGRVFAGDDAGGIDMPAARPPLTLHGDAVAINFEEAPLSDVVHSILGDTLGLDYVVEHPVQGRITLRTRSPIPRTELLPIMESLLLNNGALLVRGPGDRFFISRAGAKNVMAPRFDSPSAEVFGFTNIIVPLQHISATEMAGILKPVAPESAFVRVDGKRNLLILAGTQLQLEGWLDIVATFDIDQLAGTSVGVFPITQGEVLEVHKEILHILRAKDDKEDAGLSAMVSVLPVERLNSLLVVSPRSEYVERVGAWITELDTIEVSTSEISLHVYEVQNGNAANLASLLETIYGEGGGKKRSSEVAPGMRSQTSGSGGGGSMASTGGPAAGGSNFSLGESVKVVSDVFNNSLLVYASSYEYSKIEKILKKLDVTATQVLIEASIVEVTLTDDLQYGLEWTFQNGIGSDYQGEGSLNLSGGQIGPTAPGFAYAVTNQAGFTKAVLNALAEKSLLNVISTPSVLVLDNHTASIQVGIQQPIQSRQSVTDGGVSQTSIEYKDTGVKLQVTPSVNDGGLVTLEVIQSVTDVGNIDLATRQRSFNERSVSSKVAVRDGDSVVLGGLIRDNASSGKSGIPLLMDIPVVGSLFSTTVDTSIRTELLIFITPRVLESDKDLRAVTTEMRTRMRGLKDFSDLPATLQNPAGEVE